MASRLPMPRYCLYILPLISMIRPGASSLPASRPPQITPSSQGQGLHHVARFRDASIREDR